MQTAPVGINGGPRLLRCLYFDARKHESGRKGTEKMANENTHEHPAGDRELLERVLGEVAALRAELRRARSRKGLLTRAEAAEYLGVSLSTLGEFTSRRKLPAVRLGDGRRRTRVGFLRADLDDFLRRHRHEIEPVDPSDVPEEDDFVVSKILAP